MLSIMWLKTGRELWQKKSLVFTLSLVLMVASGAYIGMSSVYQDMKLARDQYYLRYHLADFSVLCKAVPQHLMSSLRRIKNVRQVSGRVRTRVTFQGLASRAGVLAGEAYSLPTLTAATLNQLHLKSGVYPKAHSRDMIVLAQFAAAHHLHLGQHLNVVFPAGLRSMRIVGMAYSPEQVIVMSPDSLSFSPQEFHFGVIYVPETTLAELAGLRGQYNDIMVAVNHHSPSPMKLTMQHVAKRLDEYGVRYKLLTQDQVSVSLLNVELENIRIMSTFFPFIFLFVGALVINVLLQRLVKQQQVVIGMLKAMGFSNKALVWHYLSYGIVIGVLGSALGLGLGLWIQQALVDLYRDYFQLPLLTYHLHLSELVIGIGVSVLAAVLGAMVSVLRIVRLSPVAAMHPEAATGKSNRCLWQVGTWLRCPFYWKMAIRSIFRDLWRSLVSVYTVTLGLTLVYMALTMGQSMINMVDLSIDHLNHYDVAVGLRDPVGYQVVDVFQQLPFVEAVETQLTLPVTMSSADKSKEAVVEALPNNNHLFTPHDQMSRPVHIPAQGLVLSRTLANQLHVTTGDLLEMQPLLGHRQNIAVKVKAVIDTYLGFPAYANQTWLSQLVNSDVAFNKILLKLKPGYDSAALTEQLKQLSNVTSIHFAGTMKADFVKTIDEFLGGFVATIILFAAIIAVSSLYNNAMVALNERQREVATLSVLGLSSWEVFRLFLLEGALLLFLGLIVAMPVAYFFTHWMLLMFQTEYFRFPVQVYYSGLFQAVLVILLFFLLSYIVVWRFICRVPWQKMLNIRE